MKRNIKLFALPFIVASLTSRVAGRPDGIEMSEDTSVDIVKIFDFTTGSEDQIDDWWEVSDTVREPGMSKAGFTIQKSRLFQRAVFFALINPQPNGAGFAGIKTNLSLELDKTGQGEGLLLQLRSQGDLKVWKVVMTNTEFSGETAPYSYEAKFRVTQDHKDFQRINIPFTDFQAYYRGALVPDAPPLKLEKIGTFGLQSFGGVYDEYKQSGVGSLEIDFIAMY